MRRLLTPSFWLQLFISTFMTMVMIYIIKMVAGKFQIPVVSNIAESV